MVRNETLDRICTAAIIFGFLNFMAFWLIAVTIGGDAINGQMTDGRFYLYNHGVLTEVSEPVFRYSYAHAISVWVTLPVSVLAGLIQRWGRRV